MSSCARSSGVALRACPFAELEALRASSTACRPPGSAGPLGCPPGPITTAAPATVPAGMPAGRGRRRRATGSARASSSWRSGTRCGGTARSRGWPATSTGSWSPRRRVCGSSGRPACSSRSTTPASGATSRARAAKPSSSCPPAATGVWQMDFFELETSGGGTWRSGDVIDYATKLVLAGPVTATQTHRDAIASVQVAIEQAEQLLEGSLIDDLTDPATGESRRSTWSATTGLASRRRPSRASSPPGPSCRTSAPARTRRRPTASSSATTAPSRLKRFGASCPPTAPR